MGRDKMVNCIICQVGAPCGFLKAKGMDLNHITPHGSLSGLAARQDGIAHAICDAADVFRRTGCLDHCETCVPGAVYASTWPALWAATRRISTAFWPWPTVAR